ncbi:helix-turn-helix domain-containing protein [Saccharopolyspora pogona]|uniref:helix-turn-helix domain-containing protein n=1 Tax=Saccharopolyspora pogona TaxID=333966 RepID=UPI0021DFA465|nr:helix-turn-helix domain-containing protein [Saccharopolyspora pogona]
MDGPRRPERAAAPRQKPKLGPRQVHLARQMHDERGPDGKRRYTVRQIADEFGVTRPTIYRHLNKTMATA